MTFRLTSAAEADLAEIVDYLATEAGPDRADAVLIEILRAAERVAEMPRLGHTRRDLTDDDVLFWTVYTSTDRRRPRSRLCASCMARATRVSSWMR